MVKRKKSEAKQSLMRGLFSKAAESLIPLEVTFELTYQCNLTCQHCYISTAEKDELSLSEICSIIDQLYNIGTLFIAFTGGEVFVRKDFLEILRYVRRKGFVVFIQTNGTLIDSSIAGELRSLGISKVEISLLGATSRTHDNITQMAGSFKKTIRCINLLKNLGVALSLKTPLMSFNIHECAEIKSLANKLGVNVNTISWLTPTKDGNKRPQMFNLDREQFGIAVAEFNGQLIPKGNGTIKTPKKLLCKAGKAVCSINPKGIVNPCVLMPIEIGDLRSKKFEEIWFAKNNYHLNRLRSMDPNRLSCASCNKLDYCTRCPGLAYLEEGDFFSLSPSACRMAEWRIEEISKMA